MLKKEQKNQWLNLIIIAIILYWLVNNMSLIGNILSKLLQVLTPFLLGIVFAFILNIPMTKIEHKLNKIIDNKKFPTRIISITLSLIIFSLVISFVLFLLLPEIIDNIQALIKSLPILINKIETWTINLLNQYPNIQNEIKEIFANNSIEKIIPEALNYLVNGAINFITGLVTGIITFFTSIVFSIYLLSQKESVIKGGKRIIKAYFKPVTEKRIIEIAKLANQTFTKFVSGQCVEAIILGTIFFIVLSIFKFPYALIISVLTTITALIPIFGALIAMVIGAILIAIESPLQALIFIIIFQIIQQIEGNIIYPRVVGKSVGLSPLWTLFAISVGGSLFGLIGMLVALPLAAIFHELLKESVNNRLKTK